MECRAFPFFTIVTCRSLSEIDPRTNLAAVRFKIYWQFTKVERYLISPKERDAGIELNRNLLSDRYSLLCVTVSQYVIFYFQIQLLGRTICVSPPFLSCCSDANGGTCFKTGCCQSGKHPAGAFFYDLPVTDQLIFGNLILITSYGSQRKLLF